MSINKTIEKDAQEKGYEYVYKNFRTLNNLRLEEEEEQEKTRNLKFNKSLDTKESQNNDKSKSKNILYSSSFLPQILPSYPIKYIINRDSFKGIIKKAEIEEEKYKRGEKLT